MPSIHRYSFIIESTILLSLADLPAAGQKAPAIPEPIRKLHALAGHWRAERVEFLDAGGQIRRVSTAESCNHLYLDGLVLHHVGRLDEPAITTHGWYSYDPVEKQLRVSSVSSRGMYDQFVGRWEDDTLILTMLSSPSYGDRRFRLVSWEIQPDSYRERLEVSDDDGRSWLIASRQRFQRVNDGDESGRFCARERPDPA